MAKRLAEGGNALISIAMMVGLAACAGEVDSTAVDVVEAARAEVDLCQVGPVTRVRGTLPAAFHADEPSDTRTYDLRQATSIGMPFSTTEPFVIGEKLQQQARHLCVLGGNATSSALVKEMPRPYVKQKYAGHAVYVEGVEGHTYVADGARIDHAEDGFMPLGDGFILRNAYISNIRDDCVENDTLSGGLIEDTLFDGCYMGISVDPGGLLRPAPTEEDMPLVLDRVLMRLKPLPDPVVARSPDGLEHNRIWKLAQNILPIIVRDSVLLVEERGAANNQPFPADFVAEDVTLVWLGPGAYPFRIPAGVTVVTDVSVWELAREDWLARHGYPLTPDYPGLGRTPVTGDGFVELTWRLGSGARSYRIERAASSGGPYETIAQVEAAAARLYTDRTVENGTRYYYVVTSINEHGESERSNEALAVPTGTAAAPPLAPEDLVATADATSFNHGHHSAVSGRVELSWNHVAGAEEYLVRRGPNPGQYTFETPVRGNTYLDVGRPVGAPNYYQVVARSRAGLGAPSLEASATAVAVEQFLSTPRFRPPVAGDGQISLRWLSDPLSPGTRYTIRRALQAGGPFELLTEVMEDVQFTDTGLENGVTYYYAIQQHDAEGESGVSEEVFETPQAMPVVPEMPTGLSARAQGNGVTLAWNSVSLATHYTIWRASSPDGPFESLHRFVRARKHQDAAVRSGTTYFYQVSAINSWGESGRSGVASAAVGAVDRTAPSVSVAGVHDGAVYTLGDVPLPTFSVSDGGGVEWKRDELLRPRTATGAGQYTHVATAQDRATNQTIVYTTYRVHYRFGGFRGALAELERSFDKEATIPVVFHLSDARGQPVDHATWTVLVDGIEARAWPLAEGGDAGEHGEHVFPLDARQLSEDLHLLTVLLDDGTAHHTTFRLARMQ